MKMKLTVTFDPLEVAPGAIKAAVETACGQASVDLVLRPARDTKPKAKPRKVAEA